MGSKRDFKPWLTYAFLVINIGWFAFTYLVYGTTTDSRVLLDTGANFMPYVFQNHEYWRLLSATFVHIGMSHLLFNMMTLYFMGPELEEILGHIKFLLIYLIAGIGGNLTSLAFNTGVSAGASTALFGMFAAFIVLAIIHPDSHYLWQRSRSFIILVGLNLVNGFLSPGIDNWGHLGGLLFGALATYVIGSKGKSKAKLWQRGLVAVLSGIIAVFLVYYAYQEFLHYFER